MPSNRPPDSQRRSRRAGRRSSDATQVTAHTTTSRVATIRLPNSMTGCRESGGVSCWWLQVGQSGQPRPEPDRRTAAPVATLRTIVAREIRHSRRKARGLMRERGHRPPIVSSCSGRPAQADRSRDRVAAVGPRGLGVVWTRCPSLPWPLPGPHLAARARQRLCRTDQAAHHRAAADHHAADDDPGQGRAPRRVADGRHPRGRGPGRRRRQRHQHVRRPGHRQADAPDGRSDPWSRGPSPPATP